MSFVVLLLIGALIGVTTVVFGFGGGFVAVPVVAVADAGLGGDALRVATATSALVMLVNAAVATAATRRTVLVRLRGRGALLALLVLGGAVGALLARSAPDAVLRWGFVVYLAATVVDLLVRPGFLPRADLPARGPADPGGTTPGRGIRTAAGLPIGAVASFLGVGGSVMTVPMLRRAGVTMPVATALANPLTLAIVAPAVVVTLLVGGSVPASPGVVGSVDVRTAVAIVVTAIPVIVLLRRRPPRIPDGVHAWGYLAMLVAAGVTVAVA